MNLSNKILGAVQKGLYEGLSKYDLTILDDDDSVVVKGKKAFDKNNVDYAEEDIINSNYDINVILNYYRNSYDEKVKELALQYILNNFVDMGTSVLWYKYNLNATNEYDPGYYYQWADTKGYKDAVHKSFSRNTYKYYDSDIYSASSEIQQIIPGDNAALKLFQPLDITIPTILNFTNLMNNCTYSYINNGILFKSNKTNNKLFVPAGGKYIDNELVNFNDKCYLWTKNSYHGISAYNFLFGKSDDAHIITNFKQYGMPIRPVISRFNYNQLLKTIKNK